MKILVVVMGILIIAGVVTIVVTIVSRLSDKSRDADAKTVARPDSPAVVAPFGDVSHALPAGARVHSVAADSGRLYIHLETAEGPPVILVLDGATGAKIGEVGFAPAR
jgi:hypothetical protein